MECVNEVERSEPNRGRSSGSSVAQEFPDPDFRWNSSNLGFTEIVSALSNNPEDASLAYQLAVRWAKEKKYALAEPILRDLLKRENCFEVLEALTICLYHQNNWSECAHMARQALMLSEGFRDQRFELLKFLGNCLIQLRDLDGAQEVYEKAFLLFPGSDVLQVNFGTLWIQRSEWNSATECFRHALFLNLDNDRAWVGLALCHRVRGDIELSFANIERALDENQMNDTALSLMLEWARERSEFNRAFERFTDFTDAGGFSAALSTVFIQKARQFGLSDLAGWEEFHLRIRSESAHE